ncbi:Histidine biosynthesis bifunctional protein hisB [Dipsacomyces acuminosporus]|nr:Histidine biosynthesis bifunctional protein hisB [Dipsacomyces acuminosporus]
MSANAQKLYLLDYGAGNVRSLLNAVEKLGHSIQYIKTAEDFDRADKIIFPGVGAFGYAMKALRESGFVEPLKAYIASGRPLMGICVGMQVLFEGSDESPEEPGLGIFQGRVKLFDNSTKAVPHMGWNAARVIHQSSEDAAAVPNISQDTRYYFVHSYGIPYTGEGSQREFVHTATRYGDEAVVSSVWKGSILASQFHPEKSGTAGLAVLQSFIEGDLVRPEGPGSVVAPADVNEAFTVRVIACLDVRANDQGDLVVTKGDQYDVRESASKGGDVRNLGKPVELAKRYFDEVQVAGEYFRSGADKVSIGSDAVYAAERYWQRVADGQRPLDGSTAIEQIAERYGRQAVVISVDPRRIYVRSPEEADGHHVIKTAVPGPSGEQYCWYQCTVKGGREGRDTDVRQLVTACEALGAGEILLNCMDKDGTNSGYDLELIADTKAAVKIPVIASSGAGKPEHFSEVVDRTGVEAVLAAGIFHRREVPLESVKAHLHEQGIPIRNTSV